MAAPFKVLIAGGSVAGLSLANMLERYGIDFEVFEKHAIIAPQLGASIGIFPNGFRILDQLGCLDAVDTISTPINSLMITGPDGKQLASHHKFGDYVEELVGYRARFMDRRGLIQTLYEHLTPESRSKVHTSAEIIGAESTDSGVVVTTKGGSTHKGSILVGADGVHSQVRELIWQLAKKDKPWYMSATDENSIKCSYSCLFGISENIDAFKEDEGFKSYHDKRSYLCQGGPDGKFYSFLFIKNESKSIGKDIPQYTEDDQERVAEKYAGDILARGLTFGDIYQRRQVAILVPLEEYVLKKPFHDRFVVIGDAYHKVNPLTGAGGNAALESAACLSDLLVEYLRKTNNRPDSLSIQQLFTRFAAKRGPRAVKLMKASAGLQDIEALASPFARLLALHVLSKFRLTDILQQGFSVSNLPGVSLRYLPAPQRQQKGLLPFQENISIQPGERPMAATFAALSILCVLAFTPYYLPTESTGSSSSELLGLYTYTLKTAIVLIWTVESSRPMAFLSALGSAMPFIVASLLWSWKITVPFYIALHIFKSGELVSYFPTPREIETTTAAAIPFGIVAVYVIPLLSRSYSSTPSVKWENAALIMFPLLVTAIGKAFAKLSSPKTPRTAFASLDLPYLLPSYTVTMLVTGTTHLLMMAQCLRDRSTWSLSNGLATLASSETAILLPLGLSIAAWCLFTAWDLRRVNIAGDMPLGPIWLAMIISLVALGPATLLVATWRWRETMMENGRHTRVAYHTTKVASKEA